MVKCFSCVSFATKPIRVGLENLLGEENVADINHLMTAYQNDCIAFLTSDLVLVRHHDEMLDLLSLHVMDPRKDIEKVKKIFKSLL